MKKMLKIVGTTFLISIVLLIVWLKLPVSITYHKEIKMGNLFAKNIVEYKRINHKLPEDDDWETLKKLNPLTEHRDYGEYEASHPGYKKIDSINFSLTYVDGFDPPYLIYDTKSRKWEMRYHN